MTKTLLANKYFKAKFLYIKKLFIFLGLVNIFPDNIKKQQIFNKMA